MRPPLVLRFATTSPMSNLLTNLLPEDRRRLLTREYYLRFGVVCAAVFVAFMLVAAVLLVPTYIFLVGSSHAKETRLANVTSTLSSVEEVALSDRLTALSNDPATLVALAQKPSASGYIRSVLGISRVGIALTGFTYTPTKESPESTLALVGTAQTRDSLRNYQMSLQALPTARSVTLPVSVYAKVTYIPFTITLTLAP